MNGIVLSYCFKEISDWKVQKLIIIGVIDLYLALRKVKTVVRVVISLMSKVDLFSWPEISIQTVDFYDFHSVEFVFEFEK